MSYPFGKPKWKGSNIILRSGICNRAIERYIAEELRFLGKLAYWMKREKLIPQVLAKKLALALDGKLPSNTVTMVREILKLWEDIRKAYKEAKGSFVTGEEDPLAELKESIEESDKEEVNDKESTQNF